MNKSTSPQAYRTELRKRIIEVATTEFWTKGVKAVKMDDIANNLTISKRTLYEIYENKEVLLLEVLKHHKELQREHVREFAKSVDNNVMEIIFELYDMHAKVCKKITPRFYDELQKYNKVTEYMSATADEDEQHSLLYFHMGIEQGYFRPDLDYRVLSKIMRQSIRYVVVNEDLASQHPAYIFLNVIFVFFRGFCTLKGIEAVDKKMEELGK